MASSSFLMKVGETGLSSKNMLKYAVPIPVLSIYFVFGTLSFWLYDSVSQGEFSCILTIAALAQALAFSFLCIQVMSNRSARGISAGALVLDGLSVAGRIPATNWSEGYLPAGTTGDYLYQTVDLCSLLMVLFLLHRVLVVYRTSYEASNDIFKIRPVVFACFGLAALFHGHSADNPLYDTCWMAGLFMGVMAVMPELWLITLSGGVADAWTCNYIIAMGLSRALSGLFMWEARNDVSCDQWFFGFNHAIFFILLAHFVHLMLIADFTYSYGGVAVRNGICSNERVQLEAMDFFL
jgi:hypothetical protein